MPPSVELKLACGYITVIGLLKTTNNVILSDVHGLPSICFSVLNAKKCYRLYALVFFNRGKV